MENGGLRAGAGGKSGRQYIVNRALVRELEHCSGDDFATQLLAVVQNPRVAKAVRTQAAVCLGAIIAGMALFPVAKTIEQIKAEANATA